MGSAVGLTIHEVEDLLKVELKSDNKKKSALSLMQKSYDGYRFSQHQSTPMFCTNFVLNYIQVTLQVRRTNFSEIEDFRSQPKWRF